MTVIARKQFTEEERTFFLELIEAGKTRQEAAEAVRVEHDNEHSTATRWRALYQRDEDFADRYIAALDAAGRGPSEKVQRIRELEGAHLAHRLLDEAILRALDSERGKVGASNRLLTTLAMLNVDSFKPLLEARLQRHVHEGSIGLFAMPQIDTAKWSVEEHSEFVELERRRTELLELARPDPAPGTKRSLPAGVPAVIDANGNGASESA